MSTPPRPADPPATIDHAGAMQEQAMAWARAGEEVGLVPTMGALHQGHLSLVERARRENRRVVVSIFVNPLQFGPAEDLDRYPRPLEHDLSLLRSAAPDAVFHPSVDQIYPPAFRTRIDPGPWGDVLEGAVRPGHFKGVLTVVLKLFEIVRPKRGYFGMKDWQQLLLVRQLVRDLALPMRIVACPTVREPDGLAMSSRNAYLDAESRKQAPRLYAALLEAGRAFKDGEHNPDHLESLVHERLSQDPAIPIDYARVLEETTLERPSEVAPGNVLAAAVKLGRTRLIDNLVLGGESL